MTFLLSNDSILLHLCSSQLQCDKCFTCTSGSVVLFPPLYVLQLHFVVYTHTTWLHYKQLSVIITLSNHLVQCNAPYYSLSFLIVWMTVLS